jgi:hypothetical protein
MINFSAMKTKYEFWKRTLHLCQIKFLFENCLKGNCCKTNLFLLYIGKGRKHHQILQVRKIGNAPKDTRNQEISPNLDSLIQNQIHLLKCMFG